MSSLLFALFCALFRSFVRSFVRSFFAFAFAREKRSLRLSRKQSLLLSLSLSLVGCRRSFVRSFVGCWLASFVRSFVVAVVVNIGGGDDVARAGAGAVLRRCGLGEHEYYRGYSYSTRVLYARCSTDSAANWIQRTFSFFTTQWPYTPSWPQRRHHA